MRLEEAEALFAAGLLSVAHRQALRSPSIMAFRPTMRVFSPRLAVSTHD